MTAPLYLDHNATAPLRPEAREAVLSALAETGNPSSVHGFGRAARRRVEDARAQVAALIGAKPADIAFTSGGTEANALALRGSGRPRILASAVEHDSVLALAQERVPVRSDGIVDLAALERLLAGRGGQTVVALMLANNETGVLQPVAEAVRIAHAAGALLHCDAIQAAGKIAVDLGALGADTLALSAHKLGGPQGIGAVALARNAVVAAQLVGGGQERGRRAGTENVPGIAGFGAACAAARNSLGAFALLAAWRDRLETEALANVPAARIFGADAPRLPNTICLALPGFAAEKQVMALDLAGIAVSAGSACSSGKVRASHVLEAMGADAALAGCAIRISLGWSSEAGDAARFLAAWTAMAKRRRPG